MTSKNTPAVGSMFAQLTIEKPASKPASKPAKLAPSDDKAAAKKLLAATKAADKAAAAKIEAAKIEAAKNATTIPALKYALIDYCRPSAGGALFAHTQAFFELSGLSTGGAYAKAKALQVIGNTAIKYHSSNGNFETTDQGLKLTAKGQAFFAIRPINAELKNAFIEVMTTGKPNDKANVKAESSRVLIK